MKRRYSRRKMGTLWGLFVAVILMATASGCGVPAPAGTCDVIGRDNPHRSSGTPSSMDGKTRVRCGPNVSFITIDSEGQRYVNGAWQSLSHNVEHYSRVQAGKTYVGMWFAPCDSGTWRTRSRVSIRASDGSTDSGPWNTSNEVDDPCSKK